MKHKIIVTIQLIVFTGICGMSQTLLSKIGKVKEVTEFDGFIFTAENNSQYSFTRNGQKLELNLKDTLSYIVFNDFVKNELYPKRPKILYPKVIIRKGENDIDSIRASEVGLLYVNTLRSAEQCLPKIFPIAIKNSKHFMEFLLLTDVPEGIFVELYSYDKERKRVLSYIPLFKGEKVNKETCSLYGVNQVSSYQTVGIEQGVISQLVNDGFNEIWTRKLRINEGGYYEILWYNNPMKNSQVFNAVIDDPDGYTNVRILPDSKSEIIYKIKAGEEFKVEKFSEAGNWYKIFDYKDRYEGWIHKSRVKKISN